MLWRGARSFGDAADVFTSNWPSGKWRPRAALARGQGLRVLGTPKPHIAGICCLLSAAFWQHDVLFVPIPWSIRVMRVASSRGRQL